MVSAINEIGLDGTGGLAQFVAAVEKGFNLSVSKTIQANHYMQQHIAAIAADDLRQSKRIRICH
jgi:hypothetical protein